MRDILEAARSAPDLATYERVVFAHLDRVIGQDVGLFVRDGVIGAVGVDDPLRATWAARRPVYTAELRPFIDAAFTSSGVLADTEFFSTKERDRNAFHRDMVRPFGGRSTLIGVLEFRQRPVGVVVLGRTRARSFRDADKAFLRELLPALSVADIAARTAPERADALGCLTSREREIASYLELGYTNREIGLALGTSFRTVRNQLSAIFAKLDVANRAEAVARLLDKRR